MLKTTLNRARLSLRLTPRTPLLIKSGDKGATLLHPERPDLTFVRTVRPDRGETVYLPGASLKGVVRSAAERALRSLPLRCCDPLDQRGDCHRKASKRGDDLAQEKGELRMAEVYRTVCYACRVFGSQAIAARVHFSDAYPPADQAAAANATETRNGVSIDRQTGGPARGKLYEFEVVTSGAFDTAIHLTNYELWQLGLIALVLGDIREGFVQLGSAKSRGLGQMGVEVRGLLIEQVKRPAAGDRPAGVSVLEPSLLRPYDLVEEAPLDLPGGGRSGPAPLGQRFSWDGDVAGQALDRFLGAPWDALCRRIGK